MVANKDGRGPAWSNSLFEDNAEFGLGLRLAADLQADLARQRLAPLRPELGEELVVALARRSSTSRTCPISGRGWST